MVSNLRNLLELLAYVYCLAELFGKKLKISIHLVIFVILQLFLLVGIRQYGFPQYLLSLSYIGMFLYGLLYYRESIKLTLVNCFLAAVIVTVLQLLVLLPTYYLFFIQYEQIEVNGLLVNIACFLLIVLGSYKIKLMKLSAFFMRGNKLIAGVAIVILCGLAINIYQMKNEGGAWGGAYIQVLYFFFIFLFTIYEWQKTKTDAERRKAQLEMNRLYYDAYDQLIMLVRERQHDMKSHINAILNMAYMTDNYDELIEKQKEYCGYVIEQNEKTRLVLSTGNPLISGFLYSKIQEAESKGITLEYHIGVTEIETILPEYELIEMMSILTNNAIEALSKPEENPDTDSLNDEKCFKKIYIFLKESEEIENSIELTVANTSEYCEEDVTEHFFETGYSSKGKGRGIGLPKLKRLVHDRKGDIIVSNERYEGRNCLAFIIRLPKEKNTI